MFDLTKAALRQTVQDFKKADHTRSVLTQLVYLAYLAYCLIVKTGILAVNILLTCICVVYLIFFLIVTEFGKSPDGSRFKAVKRGGALIFRWSKRIIRLFTLGVALYGLCQTVEAVTPLAVILVALMIVGWILQIIFELIIKIVSSRISMLMEGFEADVNQITAPAKKVENTLKKLTGQEVEPPKPLTKTQLKLKELADLYNSERQQKKRELKLERKQAKRRARIEKRKEKERLKQSVKAERALLKATAKAKKKKAQLALPPAKDNQNEESSAN